LPPQGVQAGGADHPVPVEARRFYCNAVPSSCKEEAMAPIKLHATAIFPPRVIPPVPVGPPVPEGGTPDLGTLRVFSEDLRDTTTNALVGQHSGTCVHVRQPNMWLCHAGWTLEKVGPGAGKTGSLVAGGLLDFAAAPPIFGSIFGGTGDFDKARGKIEGTPVADTDPQQWDYKVDIVGG
jgi:Dirigent-like protein